MTAYGASVISATYQRFRAPPLTVSDFIGADDDAAVSDCINAEIMAAEYSVMEVYPHGYKYATAFVAAANNLLSR